MAKGGSSTTQEQSVQQNTTVTVQNVIEDRGLEPLERVKLITEVLATIDTIDAQGKAAAGPSVAIIQPQAAPLGFLSDSKTVVMLTAAIGAIILIARAKRA